MVKEAKAHYIVSRAHVEGTWPAWRRKVFEQCAYPLSENIFVTWNDKPEAWFPTNHSCDPSAMLDGLDFIARRALRKGDTITLDYATFCGESLAPFRCQCQSPQCRGIVGGSDYLEPWVMDRYGRYLSDFAKNGSRALGVGRSRAGGCTNMAK